MNDDRLTYPEVGATQAALQRRPAGTGGSVVGALPPGYRHLVVAGRLPAGTDLAPVARRLLTWRLHRDAGARVQVDGPVAPGVRATSRLGPGPSPVTAPCEVVWVLDGPDLAGFGYGTLPGHPFSGEEAFALRREADGTLTFLVVAFSRPARWWSALAGPAVPLLQRRYARGLLRAAGGTGRRGDR